MTSSPSIDRRRLLLGLASASATGAAIVAAGATMGAVFADAAKASEPIESAVLLALGDELAPAKAEMVAASEALEAVMRRWWWKWPVAPEGIVKTYRDDYARERGLDGSLIGPDGQRNSEKARPLFSAHSLGREINEIDRQMKRRRPKYPLTVDQLMELEAERAMLTDKLELARNYEAATATTLEASGYGPAKHRQEAAREALLSLVSRIMAEPETTMAGVIIKAEALTAWSSAPYHQVEWRGWAWPQQLAASLLRIAGEAPVEQA